MFLLFLSFALFNLLRLAHCTCESYGIDFTNGGSYFIDSTEAIDFTFLTQFEGWFPCIRGVDRAKTDQRV